MQQTKAMDLSQSSYIQDLERELKYRDRTKEIIEGYFS